MKKIFFTLLGLFFLATTACASKDFQEPGTLSPSSKSNERTFRAPYNDAWTATLAALEAKKYAAAQTLKDSGIISTDWVLGKSDRLYSGYGDTRIPYAIRFKLTARMKPSRSGITVVVTNEEQYYTDSITSGTDFAGSIYQWIPTESSSLKESALLDEIEHQLTRMSAANH